MFKYVLIVSIIVIIQFHYVSCLDVIIKIGSLDNVCIANTNNTYTPCLMHLKFLGLQNNLLPRQPPSVSLFELTWKSNNAVYIFLKGVLPVIL